jgi:hypothetical protein
MRSAWNIIAILIISLTIFCTGPRSAWLKDQESLDLAYPNELSFRIEMQKKSFFEGEPLVSKMFISNKLDRSRTILHIGNRTSMIAGGLLTFKIVTEFDSVLMYSGYILANIVGPYDATELGPDDTLYFHAILYPDLFRQYDYPMKWRKLQPGEYVLESNIYLGTKYYPKPARTLFITSHPTLFSIVSLPAEEQEELSKIRLFMKNFFGCREECLIPFNNEDNDQEEFVDSALFWLDQIRNTNSYFAPFADFTYTCIPAVTRTHSDTLRLNRSISEAKKFIEKYNGSILAEEMEFKLAWWLFYKDSTSREFYDHAKKVVKKYPKNINSFGIKRHIPVEF